MESDRVRALAEYEDRDNVKKLERLKGAQVLHQQIEDNEQFKLLEQEKKDQETKVSFLCHPLFFFFIFHLLIVFTYPFSALLVCLLLRYYNIAVD